MSKWCNEKISWFEFSKFRDYLFGLSILDILIFHFFENVRLDSVTGIYTVPTSLYDHFFGSIGVEAFLFLSAMGLYFSFKKNRNLTCFYKKRIFRIIPEYLIVSIITCSIIEVGFNKGSLLDIIKDVVFINIFTGLGAYKRYWFILLIIVLYFIYPFIFSFIDNEDKNKRLIYLVSSVAMVYFCIALLRFFRPNLYNNIEIAILRIPIFVIGCYCSKNIYERKGFTIKELFIFFLAIIIKIFMELNIIHNPTGRLSATIFVVPLMVISIIFLKSIIHFKTILRFLKWTGIMSLELYIIHVSLRDIFIHFGVAMSNLLYYILMILITYILSIALKSINTIIINRIRREK